MSVVLKPVAANDVRAARASYERKAPGLGDDFEACLAQALATVRENAEIYQVVEVARQVRRALLRRFPYAVYYVVEYERERAVVLAVLPTAVSPSRWQQRK